jgi:hypothetical protein
VLETFGASGNAKLQLRPPNEAPGTRDVEIALGARVVYHQVRIGGTPEHQVGIGVPLLFGWRMGQASELVLAARFDYQVWFGESQTPLHVPFVGGSAGFVWQFSPRWAFAPELVLLWSPLSFNGESGSDGRRGLTILSLGLGVGYRW